MDTPTELEENELAAVLERGHAAVADAPRRLMICHTPPYDTRLDRLVNGRPVGSPAVRAFIERHAPDVAVVGHIHEGRGVDRVGRTLVLNAGALRDGGYVVVDDDGRTLAAELRSFWETDPRLSLGSGTDSENVARSVRPTACRGRRSRRGRLVSMKTGCPPSR